jgi:cobaltochelatase CobN
MTSRKAFAYLGVRPVWDKQSNRVTGFEVMPLATLDRPRIDVTLRISGLFRDIFESQIALFDLAVRKVAALDEDDQTTRWRGPPRRRRPRARVRRRARQLRRAGRGPGARRSVEDARGPRQGLSVGGDACLWRRRLDAVGGDGFRTSVSGADVLGIRRTTASATCWMATASPTCRRLRRAAAMLGNTPELYHLDTSRPEAPKARPDRRGDRAWCAAASPIRAGSPACWPMAIAASPRSPRRGRALRLCRDRRRRAGPSVRCHARGVDRR